MNLRPLGPESRPGETPGSARARTESQGLGNTGARKDAADALGALPVSAVTQHGEPVGTRLAADFLRAVLDALGRDGDLTKERLWEIEGLVRDALRALSDARVP